MWRLQIVRQPCSDPKSLLGRACHGQSSTSKRELGLLIHRGTPPGGDRIFSFYCLSSWWTVVDVQYCGQSPKPAWGLKFNPEALKTFCPGGGPLSGMAALLCAPPALQRLTQVPACPESCPRSPSPKGALPSLTFQRTDFMQGLWTSFNKQTWWMLRQR